MATNLHEDSIWTNEVRLRTANKNINSVINKQSTMFLCMEFEFVSSPRTTDRMINVNASKINEVIVNVYDVAICAMDSS